MTSLVLHLDQMSAGPLSPFENAVSGSAGSLFSNTLVYPLDVYLAPHLIPIYRISIKTRLQVQQKSLSKTEKYKGFIHAFLKIIKEEGISGIL